MGQFNPYNPIVLGNEFPPVIHNTVLLDTATEVGYRWTPQSIAIAVANVRVMSTQAPPGQPLRKCVSVNLYPHGDAPSSGVVKTLTIPVSSGTLGSGASNVGGATVADCVRNPSDTAWTALSGASSSVRLWFDVNAARVSRVLQNARILDVSVKYSVTGPFDTLPDGLVLSLERPSASVIFDMDNALSGPVNQYDNVIPRLSRLGDLNPFWSSSLTPNSNFERAPWHYAAGQNNHVGLTQLAASGGTNVNVRFGTSAGAAGAEFRIQYAALQITYGSEDRIGGGGFEITNGATIVNDQFVYDVPVGSLFSWGSTALAQPGVYYDVVVGQGYCGALSVAYPVPLAIDRISAGQIYPPHEGIIIRKTLRSGETWTAETTDEIPALAIYSSDVTKDATTIYPGSQTYIDQVVAGTSQLVFGDDLQALIVDNNAGTYPFVRFYARVQPATVAELVVQQVNSGGTALGPTATITVEQLLDLPEIVDGWRRVTLPWDTPVVTTGAGLIRLFFATQAEPGAPWEVLGADANPFDTATQDVAVPTYGSDTAYALVDGTQDFTGDITAMLVQAMPVPQGVAIGTAVQPLTAVDEYCDTAVHAIPTGITYITVEWTPENGAAVAGFAWYEVQRRDTTMPAGEWESVAAITDITQGQFDDYEARIGVVSSYRVRFVHVDGYTSAWSSTVTASIAAPGVTGSLVGKSVLVLTTNHNPDANVAHAMTWDGGLPAQDFTFPEGSQTTFQAMYQRDYVVAFRPLERGGVEFTRTLLVNALGIPPQTLSDGFTGLRDLAWDTVPYVCVRDELSNRWLTAVQVPTGTVRDVPRAGHLMLAAASFREVTATPAPIDYTAECEGLILRGRDNFDTWETPAGSNRLQGVLTVTDTFTRTVSAGSWGVANTGETYTLGVPSAGSVNGSQGLLTAAAAGTEYASRLSGNRDFYKAVTDFTVPAVATGARYRVSQLVHCTDQVAFSDTFTRSVASGWGTADSGQTWIVGDASQMLVTSNRGRILLGTTVRQFARFDYGRNCAEWTIGRIGLSAALTGTGGAVAVTVDIARSADSLNRVSLNFNFNQAGNTTYNVTLLVNGAVVDTSATVSAGLTSGTALSCRLRMNGPRVQVRVWQNGTSEPTPAWGIDEDMGLNAPVQTNMGVSATKNASTTNAGLYLEFDDIAAVTTDGFDCYRADLILNTDGSMEMEIIGRVANFEYLWGNNDVTGTYIVGSVIHMWAFKQGFDLRSQMWMQGQPEPWNDPNGNGDLNTDDLDSIPELSGGRFGLRTRRDSANTNTNPAMAFDNLAIYNYPTTWDVRFLMRPVADEWSYDFSAIGYFTSQGDWGEWAAEVSTSQVRWYINGPQFAAVTIINPGIFGFVKNQLSWFRFVYDNNDGSGLSRLTFYTSLDGVNWTSKGAFRPAVASGPVGLPPMPADAEMQVNVNSPAGGVWIQKVEVRADGVLLYDPDFRDRPPGTLQLTDSEGNVWTGETPLCVEP